MIDVQGPVLLIENDLFFSSKINETLKSAGLVSRTVRTADRLPAFLADDPRPAILLVHFGATGVPWEEGIRQAHAAGIPVLAYGSHVDLAAQSGARTAGATRVIPNSKMAADLIGQIQQTIDRFKGRLTVEDSAE